MMPEMNCWEGCSQVVSANIRWGFRRRRIILTETEPGHASKTFQFWVFALEGPGFIYLEWGPSTGCFQITSRCLLKKKTPGWEHLGHPCSYLGNAWWSSPSDQTPVQEELPHGETIATLF